MIDPKRMASGIEARIKGATGDKMKRHLAGGGYTHPDNSGETHEAARDAVNTKIHQAAHERLLAAGDHAGAARALKERGQHYARLAKAKNGMSISSNYHNLSRQPHEHEIAAAVEKHRSK